MNKITKRSSGSRRVQFHPDSDDIRVEQAHGNEQNINTIMKKYRITGVLPDPVLPGVYGDFSGAEDFHTAQDKLIKAKNMFMALPSDLRTTFKNDPGLFLNFVNDPANRAEAQEMGLIPSDDPPKPAIGDKKPKPAPKATDKPEGAKVRPADEAPSK